MNEELIRDVGMVIEGAKAAMRVWTKLAPLLPQVTNGFKAITRIIRRK
jgi:hypothetical protein